ncbi:MAG: type II secretion system protein N [Steroidobacteraceae bacterium]
MLLGALAIEAGVVLTRNLGRCPAGRRGAAGCRRAATPRRGPAHDRGCPPVRPGDGQQHRCAADLDPAGAGRRLALQDPSQGMAILGPNPAQAKLYAVGAAVPGGARLHAVYRDRVLLDRGGAIESRALPRKSLVAAPPPAAVSPTPGQRLQALAQNNGALLGGLIRFQMVQASGQPGKIMGFRIYPGSRGNPTTFAQLGLHSGRPVTAVNGTPLDDASRANDVLLTLSNASSATVTLVRNGAQQDVALNLAAVANEAERAAEDSATAGGAAANAE